MPEISFRDRAAVCLENEFIRLTALKGGGHIAEVYDKQAKISPLWVPSWDSIEPSRYRSQHASIFGSGPESKLLAGIMGHNLCLDIFGGPSSEEEAAGYSVHGEASVLTYEVKELADELRFNLRLPLAQLDFRRSLRLRDRYVNVRESLVSLVGFDRPVAWTQHVTLGPPFLDPAKTQFAATVGRSLVAEIDPAFHAYLVAGASFDWPSAPNKGGGVSDLRKMSPAAAASGYTTHLVDKTSMDSSFVAFSPEFNLAFGYVWKSEDYPWLGIWEENCSRQATPWNGITVTRGMEFGVSPFPESRREMIARGLLFDTPTFRWLPAYGHIETEYWICSQPTDAMPDRLQWPNIEL